MTLSRQRHHLGGAGSANALHGRQLERHGDHVHRADAQRQRAAPCTWTRERTPRCRSSNSSGAASDQPDLQITPTANPADYYDNAGISPDNNQACANYDGVGFSYSADALAKAGITPGGTVNADGLTFTWPNVAGLRGGQHPRGRADDARPGQVGRQDARPARIVDQRILAGDGRRSTTPTAQPRWSP